MRGIKMGFEFEGFFLLRNKKEIDLSQYHANKKFNQIKYERDSSLGLHYDDEIYLGDYKAIEVISPPLETKKEIKNFVGELKKEFRGFHINKSCGHHVHITVRKNPLLFFNFKTFETLRNEYLKGCNDIQKIHYNRRYSRPVISLNVIRRGLRQEFSYSPRTNTLEWRGVNMLGIKTFTEYENELLRVWGIIHNTINNFSFKRKTKIKSVSLDDKEIIIRSVV